MSIDIPIDLNLWPTTPAEAVPVQNELRHRVSLNNRFETIKTIAGVDVSYDIKTNITRAFVVLLSYPDLKQIALAKAELPTTFPYIPGFLSFREIPALIAAVKQLPQRPDMFMVDGQGIAHPRRFGIACHLGVLTDIPSIGVAKSRLTGYFTEPGANKNDTSPLLSYDRKEQIGTVLRSKVNTKVLFVSPGHKCDIATALQITQNCLTAYRLPEPTRIADIISKKKTQTALL